MDGPWIFGLRQRYDCRYFLVERRDQATLVPIIKRECEQCERGFVIHSDEWPVYHCLKAEGVRPFHCESPEELRYPLTSVHTQSIKRSWLDAKISILRKKRGVPLHTLQSHLDHYCWQMWRKTAADPFITFLGDVRTFRTTFDNVHMLG